MTDIAVYTTPDVLGHKLEMAVAWWELPTTPKKELTEYESRIYFATKGFVRGSFLITEALGGWIGFDPSEWKSLEKPIPQKPFQGFKYLKFDD